MSMTRKHFLGSLVAGIAGLGALASGKVDDLDEIAKRKKVNPLYTLGWDDVSTFKKSRATDLSSYTEWKPSQIQLNTLTQIEKDSWRIN